MNNVFKPILFLLLMFSIWGTNIILSQSNTKVDSLMHVLENQENDTSKLQNLLMITREYKYTDPIQAIKYADQSLKLSLELSNPYGQVDALYEKGELFKRIGKLDSAFYFSEKAITICDSLHDLIRLAKNLLNHGNIIRNKGDTDNAFVNYKKVHKIYLHLNDSVGISKVYNAFGIIYKIKGIYDSAAYYYQESIKICENTGDFQRISASMINLAKVYIVLDDLEKAKKYLLESVKYAQKYNLINHMVLAYTNLGIIAFEEIEFDKSLDFYNQALLLSKQIQDKTGMANLYNNIGNIYFEQKEDYNKAYEYYNKALIIFKEIDQKSGLLVNLMNIAVIHERWGNYDQALFINDTCIRIAKEIGELEFQKIIYGNIMSVYSQLANYKKAFEFQSKYYKINDSIFNLDKTKLIADLTLKYEKEKDEATILHLKNENLEMDLNLRKRTNQRNIYLFSGIGAITIIIFLFIFYRQKARKDKIIGEQKIKQLEEEKKLLAAKFLVEGQEEERKRIAKDLHDGLGVLLSTTKIQFTSIKDKSPENKALIEKATRMLEQATGDVRKISHNMMPGLLTRFGLYEATEDLIEQLNETEGLNATCAISGNTVRLPENTEIMLYRILQELVNNTIKHANASTISLKIDIQPEALKINYADNGIGFDLEEKLKLKSIGLNSIQSRVGFLGGNVTMNSKPGEGINFIIQVPNG